MSRELTALRREQMFELLRQQNLCEDTNTRLRARGFARAQLDSDEARKLKSLAVNSWDRSGGDARLAAKPGRDDEFFRTVGA